MILIGGESVCSRPNPYKCQVNREQESYDLQPHNRIYILLLYGAMNQ